MSLAVRTPEHTTATRQRFMSALRTIITPSATGVVSPRVIYMPSYGEGTSFTEPMGRIWTHANTPAGRMSQLGSGTALSFNGTSDFLSSPDAANLTPSTGLSCFAVAKVTDTAAQRNLIAKFDVTNTTREYSWAVSATDFAEMRLYLESTDHPSFRTTDAAVTMGSWRTFGTTVADVAGAGAAAAGIVMYENGAVVASTGTEDAAFTTIENTTSVIWIGAQSATPANFFAGSIALILLSASALSASQHFQLSQVSRKFFGI